MRKILGTFVFLSTLAACAHPGEMPTVRAGNDPDTAKDRMATRAAGAGGSHAPGGTGLGSGTMR